MPILFQLHPGVKGGGGLGGMFNKAKKNCCKYTVFDSHKMCLLALLGLFTNQNDRFP